MKTIYTFTAPIKVILPRKTKKDKVCYVNLNNYRNWHYIVSNNVKKAFCELMELQTPKNIPKGGYIGIRIDYTFLRRDKRSIDLGNVCSIVDKFFQDYLVSVGIIEDDNVNYVFETRNLYGGFDPEKKGKVEIRIGLSDIKL